jgi:hypothetical protein
MGICDGPHNLRNDIIKQIKRSLIGERTIIRFGDIFAADSRRPGWLSIQ